MNADQTTTQPESGPRPLAIAVTIAAGIVAALLRIVPHPPNVSGMGGLGIFGGARLRGWQAFLLPLGIMALSDLSLWLLTGFDPKYSLGHLSRVYVYASLMIYVAIGRWLADKNSVRSVALAGTLGALQFFIVTNFCEWVFQPFLDVPEIYRYSRDLDGLIACYVAALGFVQTETATVTHPFMMFTDFRLSLPWGIAADVAFTTIYLLVYAKLSRLEPVRMQEVPS